MAENQEAPQTPLRDLVNARKNAASDPSEVKYMKEREGGTGWNFSNSPLLDVYRSFDYEFKNVVPEGFTNIKDYIEKTLETKKGNAIAIELGGGWIKMVQ